MAVEVSDHDLRQGRETNGAHLFWLMAGSEGEAWPCLLDSIGWGAGKIVPSSLVDVEEPDSMWTATQAGSIGRSLYVFKPRA